MGMVTNSGGSCSHFSMLGWWILALNGTHTFPAVGQTQGKFRRGFPGKTLLGNVFFVEEQSSCLLCPRAEG